MAPLLGLLPILVHLPAAAGDEPINSLVRLLATEINHPVPARAPCSTGCSTSCSSTSCAPGYRRPKPSTCPRPGCALCTTPVVAALTTLYADPARAWTLDALAHAAATSRATLARRFAALVGDTPASYLTRWRMDLVAQRLRSTTDSTEPDISAGRIET
jgi:AraC-like DNA-binding protein